MPSKSLNSKKKDISINGKRSRFMKKVNFMQVICLIAIACSISSLNATENSFLAATCQFPVSGNINKNAEWIMLQIKEAANNDADVVHFSEMALSGYPPGDFESFKNFNWDLLRLKTNKIQELAKAINVWVVLGSAHYVSEDIKPTNCLYIINNHGKIVDRYDKSFLTSSDDQCFTAGSHPVVITISGIKCGFLICIDSCFPEIYNRYRHQGVQVLFHSYYNAKYDSMTILDEFIPSQVRTRAADNRMWILANNSAGHYSSWGACIARPDGSLESLSRGEPCILYREFPDSETTDQFSSWVHNGKLMILPENERYTNVQTKEHPRIQNRQSLP